MVESSGRLRHGSLNCEAVEGSQRITGYMCWLSSDAIGEVDVPITEPSRAQACQGRYIIAKRNSRKLHLVGHCMAERNDRKLHLARNYKAKLTGYLGPSFRTLSIDIHISCHTSCHSDISIKSANTGRQQSCMLIPASPLSTLLHPL